MILLIILGVIAVVSFVLREVFYDLDALDILFFAIGVLSTLALLLALVILPINYLVYTGDIAEYHATQQTIEQARKNGDELEKATIQNKIINMNAWVASSQYYNTTWLGLWIPDDVMKLEPLQ